MYFVSYPPPEVILNIEVINKVNLLRNIMQLNLFLYMVFNALKVVDPNWQSQNVRLDKK